MLGIKTIEVFDREVFKRGMVIRINIEGAYAMQNRIVTIYSVHKEELVTQYLLSTRNDFSLQTISIGDYISGKATIEILEQGVEE